MGEDELKTHLIGGRQFVSMLSSWRILIGGGNMDINSLVGGLAEIIVGFLLFHLS